MKKQPYRKESDSMGTVEVPGASLWGAQTQRALENGPPFQFHIPEAMLRALALVKFAAAGANRTLGVVDDSIAEAVMTAAREAMDGSLDDHFPVGVFQTGSGTSWNMNMNEVLANRACVLLGGSVGGRYPVHPNDHVNRCQSSNDVIPSAMNIAARREGERSAEALDALAAAFEEKSACFRNVPKLGRTHLQDALPMSLGQEFSGYASQARGGAARLRAAFPALQSLALGGTAIGTGTGAAPGFSDEALRILSEETGITFRSAENRFEAVATRDCMLELMGAVNTAAVSLMKIAQDLRLLSSGPRGGLGEIRLPELQPGSSIMPGKVNPVIPEIVIQGSAYIMGAYTSVVIGCQNAPLELNIMQPLIAHGALTALAVLTGSADLLRTRCVQGITADRERCEAYIEQSLAMATPLAAVFGYDAAAEVARRAYRKGRTIREEALEEGLDPSVVETALDVDRMIDGGGTGRG